MSRYLPSEEALTKSLPERMRARAPLASWIVYGLVGLRHPSAKSPTPSMPWHEPDTHMLYDLLVYVVRARDPRLVHPVWWTLRYQQPELASTSSRPTAPASGSPSPTMCKDTIPEAVIHALMPTPEEAISVIAFLALEVRRSRLVLWILSAKKVLDYATDDSSHNWNGRRFVGELAAIAAAIQECVFVGSVDGLSHDQAMKRFKERYPDQLQEQNWDTDNTLNLKGWQMVIEAILTLRPSNLPHVLEDRIVEKKGGKTLSRSHGVTLLACLGVEFADFDTTWIDTLIRNAMYLERVINAEYLKRATISEFLISDVLKYVRGPKMVRILGQLYGAILQKWIASDEMRTRGVVCNSDELGSAWLILAERAAGYELVETGSGGNCPVPVATERANQCKTPPGPEDVLMRHPEEFQATFEALIARHTPDHADCHVSKAFGNVAHQWDTTSPLFCSVASMAIGKLLGNAKYTKLLGFLLKATEKCRLSGPCPEEADEATQHIYLKRSTWSWLEWPRFFTQICLHHVSLLPMVLQHTCNVTKHDDNHSIEWTPKPHCVERLQNALWCSMVNEKRQSTRLLVQVLRGCNLTTTVAQDSHGLDSEADIGFLAFYVLRMGAGASEDDRAKHDEEYGAFVNQRVERDFVQVLRAGNWSVKQMYEALRFASEYNRPICASVLMSAPYLLVPGEDAFLQNINSWLHTPGNIGAAKARAEFAERVAAAEAEMANAMSY